jgi:hypothetical protein
VVDRLWFYLLWIGLSALVGYALWRYVGPAKRVPRRVTNPYGGRTHKASRVLFWPALALLVLAASASALVAISAVLFNRLPFDVLTHEWPPTWTVLTRIAMSVASLAVISCVAAALRCDPTASTGVLRRMLTSISFTMLCLLSGGALFGPAIPSSGDPVRVPPGQITMYTSGSTRVDASVDFGGSYSLTDKDQTNPPTTNAGQPSGGIVYTINFVGQPGSVAGFAIVNGGSAIAEAAVAPSATSFSVTETAPNGKVLQGSLVDGQCVSDPPPQRVQSSTGQLLRGTAVVGANGRASVRVVAKGSNSWFQMSGGRSAVSLPVVQTGLFGDCGNGYEELSGTWTKPERFIVRATVRTRVELGAVVSARPELSDPLPDINALESGLQWAVNEIDADGRPEVGGDLTGAFLWPRYSIETVEAARLAAAALFASGLLAAAALTGVFEIVITWPRQSPTPITDKSVSSTKGPKWGGPRRTRPRKYMK